MDNRQRQASSKAAAETAAVADLFGAGIKYHQAGRLAEAEACYRRVLAAQPNHADALNMLGVVAQQVGRCELAVGLIRRAIQNNEKNPTYFFNLGYVLRDQGKLDDAISAVRQAIGIKPDMAEAHFSLGCHLHDQDKLEEAATAYHRAIALKPDMAEAHSNLGNALRKQDQADAAVTACREAIRLKPDLADAHCNLGTALHDQGKLKEAAAAYEQAIRLNPGLAKAHYNLGTVLCSQGKGQEAMNATLHAIRIKPDYGEAHSNIGSMLQDQGRLDDAIRACREAIQIQPRHLQAHLNLAAALFGQGKLDEAITANHQVIHIKPDHAEAYSNIGSLLRDQGRLDQAVIACRQAIRIQPDLAMAYSNLAGALCDQAKFDEAVAVCREANRLKLGFSAAYSSFLFRLNYSDRISPAALFKAHRSWDKYHASQMREPITYANDRRAERRLKVGYMSSDFRGHSAAFFLEPLVENHDRNEVELFCYAEVSAPDAWTERFEDFADHWVTTVGMSDEALAERIRRDGIDILVDLAGHTAKNRLPVFARKPAPVQVTWLGYPNTTGLKAIDYRLVDAVTDPEGEADGLASEILVRLPGGFLCYGAPADAPAPGPVPLFATGAITFGSFNNPAKLSAATLDVWALVLARLPQARLLLKGKPFADSVTRALYLDRLAKRGVAAERIELVAWLPEEAHLASYGRVDIALDPFPYNGTTTTCEALWMGVPVVTLWGDRHAGRVGASLLTQIGLTDLIADSVEAYVETAVALAGDSARLSELRRSLRPRMTASPLCDAVGFARKIEHAYRTMWQRWCAATDPGEFEFRVQP